MGSYSPGTGGSSTSLLVPPLPLPPPCCLWEQRGAPWPAWGFSPHHHPPPRAIWGLPKDGPGAPEPCSCVCVCGGVSSPGTAWARESHGLSGVRPAQPRLPGLLPAARPGWAGEGGGVSPRVCVCVCACACVHTRALASACECARGCARRGRGRGRRKGAGSAAGGSQPPPPPSLWVRSSLRLAFYRRRPAQPPLPKPRPRPRPPPTPGVEAAAPSRPREEGSAPPGSAPLRAPPRGHAAPLPPRYERCPRPRRPPRSLSASRGLRAAPRPSASLRARRRDGAGGGRGGTEKLGGSARLPPPLCPGHGEGAGGDGGPLRAGTGIPAADRGAPRPGRPGGQPPRLRGAR